MDAKNGIAVRKSYGFRDEVVKNVVDKFVERSDVGYEKYGQTLHDERTSGVKDLAAYLNDIQEELMDAILYIQTAREEIANQYKPPMAYATGEDYDDETDEE